MMLIAYPQLPRTSSQDRWAPIPMPIYEMHRVILAVRGLDEELFPTPSELIQASLLLSHYDTLRKWRALEDDRYRAAASTPARRQLLSALQEADPILAFEAYRACVAEDGLPEITEEFERIVSLCG